VADEPAHLLAIIGRWIFTYEFMSHSKPTDYLTQVSNVRAKDYTSGMAACQHFGRNQPIPVNDSARALR